MKRNFIKHHDISMFTIFIKISVFTRLLRFLQMRTSNLDDSCPTELGSFHPSAGSESRNGDARDLAQRQERDRPSNGSGWSGAARVARAPLIAPTGCLPRRKSWLYVCKCRVYAMRVGTLMLGDRGCRSHASRWGPTLGPWVPSLAHACACDPPLFFLLLFPASFLTVFSHLCFHVSVSYFPPFLSDSLSFSRPSFLADLGHYIYGRWRYSLPNASLPNGSPCWLVVSSWEKYST